MGNLMKDLCAGCNSEITQCFVCVKCGSRKCWVSSQGEGCNYCWGSGD